MILLTVFQFGCDLDSAGPNADDDEEKDAESDNKESVDSSISFDKIEYEGTGTSPVITLISGESNTSAAIADTAEVHVYSEETDTDGEWITVTETGANTSYFTGTVGLERTFTNSGYVGITADNDKVAVYADGWAGNRETITAEYQPGNSGSPITSEADYSEPSSTVSGFVTDTTGNIVTGASVQLYNSDRSIDYTVGSRSDGVYAFYDIPSGVYTLKADKDGYLYMETTVIVQ